jgi:phosphoribosyl-AMP cyclohydrolase / phosphoribosyl-ATP pyrophosphohydrolase
LYKKIIPSVNCENRLPAHIIDEAALYETGGADELFLYNYSKDEVVRDNFFNIVKEVSKQVDIPIYIGCYARRFEDMKKAFYTGAAYVVLKNSLLDEPKGIEEAAKRFGSERILLELDSSREIFDKAQETRAKATGFGALLVSHVEITENFLNRVLDCDLPLLIGDPLSVNDFTTLLKSEKVLGITSGYFKNHDIFKVKQSLKEQNIKVNVFESPVPFSRFKLNSDGLIPVVVQDYKTKEVLMMAYMNEEAFNKTLETGKMTYFSRSRNCLWTKGETSGHYQYVKALWLDCDKDTLLAKVKQIGPACHTGNESCFYTNLVKKEYDDRNPLTVFSDVFEIIKDRKKNPKPGSYTNYLFEKGIDKILKKCGEEAAEIIIAAKNPDSQELKYEISDFLYHVMVLMAERDLDWSDIMEELAHRK